MNRIVFAITGHGNTAFAVASSRCSVLSLVSDRTILFRLFSAIRNNFTAQVSPTCALKIMQGNQKLNPQVSVNHMVNNHFPHPVNALHENSNLWISISCSVNEEIMNISPSRRLQSQSVRPSSNSSPLKVNRSSLTWKPTMPLMSAIVLFGLARRGMRRPTGLGFTNIRIVSQPGANLVPAVGTRSHWRCKPQRAHWRRLCLRENFVFMFKKKHTWARIAGYDFEG